MAELMNTWEAISDGTNDVERLIGQKQYNLAMVKARQTLEIMVRTLSENNGIQLTDLASNIDDLYRRGIISQTTMEHYHRIRMIGNKAIHESDDNPSGANTAYHLLSQELYAFAKDYAPGSNAARRARSVSSASAGYGRSGNASGSSTGNGSGSGSGSYGSGSGSYGSGSGSRGGNGGNYSRSGSGSSSSRNRNIDEHSVQRVSHRTSKKSSITPELIFKIMIPVVLVVLVVCIIIFIKNQNTEEVETEQELQIVVETTAPETTAPETEPPTTEPETVMVYTVIPEVLNVRSQPSTDSDKLGQVKQGETLSYISDYDGEWAVINYNDQEGYVSKQYIDARGVDPAELAAEQAAAEAEGAQGEGE